MTVWSQSRQRGGITIPRGFGATSTAISGLLRCRWTTLSHPGGLGGSLGGGAPGLTQPATTMAVEQG